MRLQPQVSMASSGLNIRIRMTQSKPWLNFDHLYENIAPHSRFAVMTQNDLNGFCSSSLQTVYGKRVQSIKRSKGARDVLERCLKVLYYYETKVWVKIRVKIWEVKPEASKVIGLSIEIRHWKDAELLTKMPSSPQAQRTSESEV